MTERKTLNRYYPLDYDPAKIPKLKGKQKEQNRLWGIRVMSPFNMRCNTCGDYIYKGKKFNSKKETVIDEDYLGIQIHRFYIRCPKCVAVIAFKTDPENCDYTLESGGTRNFEAAKTLLDMEKKKQQAIEDEEAANPMKVLENRTKQSKNEMDTIEALTELREMNARHEKVDHEGMIKKAQLYKEELERLQKEEEDRLIRELFGSAEEANGDIIRRIESDEEDEEEWFIPAKKSKSDATNSSMNPTDLLTGDSTVESSNSEKPSTSSASKSLPHKRPSSTKALLSNLIKIRKPSPTTSVGSSNSSTLTNSATMTLPSIPEFDSEPAGITMGNNIVEKSAVVETDDPQPNAKQNIAENNDNTNIKPIGALGILGNYGSSDSDSS